MKDQITSEKNTLVLQALMRARRKMGGIRKESTNPFHKSKYAALPAFIEATDEALDGEGLIILSCLGKNDEGENVLVTTLTHVDSGEWIRSYSPLLNTKGDSQGLGSAITYMRRYSMGALLNLCPDEDDDGNKACQPQPKKQETVILDKKTNDKISREQCRTIEELRKQVDDVSRANMMAFIKEKWNIDDIADLPLDGYDLCMKKLLRNIELKKVVNA